VKDVVLASRNAKKLAELQSVLEPLQWRLRLVSDFTQDAPEESAPTFLENALIKARHAAQAAGLPAIADDSGIEVDALDGRPGVQSARYAGRNASDAQNNGKLLAELERVADAQRGARYVCVLAFLRSAQDPSPLITQGDWRGSILRAARGSAGFGYDPLFLVPGHGCSAAELPAAVKNRLSHRARAAAALLQALRG
jgi:XTP/dITP diphosphohydrolase